VLIDDYPSETVPQSEQAKQRRENDDAACKPVHVVQAALQPASSPSPIHPVQCDHSRNMPGLPSLDNGGCYDFHGESSQMVMRERRNRGGNDLKTFPVTHQRLVTPDRKST